MKIKQYVKCRFKRTIYFEKDLRYVRSESFLHIDSIFRKVTKIKARDQEPKG